MNHDYGHCLDYDRHTCPGKCSRAELTADLENRPELAGLPFTWAHFEGTPECRKNNKEARLSSES